MTIITSCTKSIYFIAVSWDEGRNRPSNLKNMLMKTHKPEDRFGSVGRGYFILSYLYWFRYLYTTTNLKKES